MSLFSPQTGLSSSSSSAGGKRPAWPPPGGEDSSSSKLAPMNIELSSFALDAFSEPQFKRNSPHQHLYVLPVLFLEFLALALTRAVLPHLLLQHYQSSVYIIMGFVEFIRGLLAFISCPLFGKLSDVIGRRPCLLVTVAGTCAPVCSLALLSWADSTSISSGNAATGGELMSDESTDMSSTNVTTSSAMSAGQEESPDIWPVSWGTSHQQQSLHPTSITVFVVLLAVSGLFSSTFTLTFAYISDSVKHRDERVSAYGLALATFGLSFTIGPMMGGYLAQSNVRMVFVCSFLLTVVDLLYIYFFLPESRRIDETTARRKNDDEPSNNLASWSPLETLRIIHMDPFLRLVGQISFLYYTALWAVISTLVLYAAKRFQLNPERLGELMSALGLATMVSEAVLVRIVVPLLGERNAMRVGLLAFTFQCIVLGLAYESWHLFVCIGFSLLGNLVYPSLSSLVSGSVEPEAVGEALGAVNGIKALTEGFGPLVFGSLMTLSERSALPGWPYLLAAVIVYVAYQYSQLLPDVQDGEYVHELEGKRRGGRNYATRSRRNRERGQDADSDDEYEGLLLDSDGEEEDEEVRMLSEVDESEDERAAADESRLPLTFAMLAAKSASKR